MATLRTVLPGLPPMKPNIAVALALGGIGLVLHVGRGRSSQYVMNGFGAIILLLGAGTLFEHATGIDIGIDALLLPISRVPGLTLTIRPSVATAIALCCIGLGLTMRRRRVWPIAAAARLVGLLIGFLALVAYAYDLRALSALTFFESVALHTALCYVLLFTGLEIAKPSNGLPRMFAGDGAGAMLARRLFPAVIGLPVLMGWTIQQFLGRSSAGGPAALAILALATTMVFGVVLAATVRLLDRLDQQRHEALERLEQANIGLEETVRLRTAEAENARDEALSANRAKSEFLAGMSHEIRTPMNGIIGFATLLLDGEIVPGRRRQLQLLKDSGKSLLAILNDILDLSKIEAQRLELEKVPLSPSNVADSALSIVRSVADAKHLALRLDLAPGLPAWVEGDPARLRQILLNLLNNAIKFTAAGSVSLRVEYRTGAALRFEIADTGIGIPPEKLSLLFQDFSQVDRSINRRYGGTGLGLAISRRLVEAMGGRIGVSSVPDEGSIFWFEVSLPETDPPAELTTGFEIAQAAPGTRILVAEDMITNQIVVQAMLENAGYEVVLVDNGAEAVAAVQAEPFDLVLMDMEMPVLDGPGATVQIRALDGLVSKIPIVALSANAMPEEIARCRKAGMDEHLAKPVDRDALYRVIGVLIGRGRAAPAGDAATAG